MKKKQKNIKQKSILNKSIFTIHFVVQKRNNSTKIKKKKTKK